MAVFMFWNIHAKSVYDEIALACREHDVDVLILAESELHAPTVLEKLNGSGRGGYIEPRRQHSRLQFFVRYLLSSFEPVYDDGQVAMRRIRPPIGPEVLLVATHAPSKWRSDEDEQDYFARRLSARIETEERKLGHHTSFIIGDLNMNPFEKPMIAADAIHGVMDISIALDEKRMVKGHECLYFYNPMWSRMGNHSAGPPGTYFYNNSGKRLNLFWHTFDQVLLRPALLKHFVSDDVRVLTKIGDSSLMRGTRIDGKYSDHLPVVLRLNLDRMI